MKTTVTNPETTAAWTRAEIDALQARLIESKRWLDAFPGPLAAPCLLRRVWDTGGGDLEALPLAEKVVVGRKGDPPFAFPDDVVLSERHFRIEVGSGGRCYAEDLGSRNGLCINDRRVPHRWLVHGDKIHAGNQNFVLHDGRGLEEDED